MDLGERPWPPVWRTSAPPFISDLYKTCDLAGCPPKPRTTRSDSHIHAYCAAIPKGLDESKVGRKWGERLDRVIQTSSVLESGLGESL